MILKAIPKTHQYSKTTRWQWRAHDHSIRTCRKPSKIRVVQLLHPRNTQLSARHDCAKRRAKSGYSLHGLQLNGYIHNSQRSSSVASKGEKKIGNCSGKSPAMAIKPVLSFQALARPKPEKTHWPSRAVCCDSMLTYWYNPLRTARSFGMLRCAKARKRYPRGPRKPRSKNSWLWEPMFALGTRTPAQQTRCIGPMLCSTNRGQTLQNYVRRSRQQTLARISGNFSMFNDTCWSGKIFKWNMNTCNLDRQRNMVKPFANHHEISLCRENFNSIRIVSTSKPGQLQLQKFQKLGRAQLPTLIDGARISVPRNAWARDYSTRTFGPWIAAAIHHHGIVASLRLQSRMGFHMVQYGFQILFQ